VVRGFRRALARIGTVAVLALAGTLVVAPAAQAQEVDSYVALGDSFSSGNGTFFPDRSLSCYRSSYSYPPLVDRLRPNTDLDFRACSGATTSDVVSRQVGALNAGTDLVSITVGGNDIGFTDLIIACGGTFSPTCSSAVATANNRITSELPGKLDAVYAAIRAGAPNARAVAVLGYGRFFGSNLSCAAAKGITSTEAGLLNGIADNLDAVIGARAAAAGFSYVSAIGPFTGHDVCAADPWLNGRGYSLPDIFHPTRSGYRNGYVPMVRSVFG
jgi:lysophospholipase L1-like esterase